MKNQKSIKLPFVFALFLFIFFGGVKESFAQNPALPLKRTTYKTDKLDFGAGGTITVVGAPTGSITIEGWQQAQVEIAAEIEVQAATESDLAKLAEVNNFVTDETMGHLRITTVGTHDKKYLKTAAKNFPKNLVGLPFRVDYKIKVPQFSDLEIDGGNGDFRLSGVDGTMKINFLHSNARLDLVGGMLSATFGEGTVDVVVPSRGWRGRYADVQLAKGALGVQLPVSLNAEINASVLRTGKIENLYEYLKPRERKVKFTDQLINAKAGAGGVSLNFTVGDGNLKIAPLEKNE